MKKGRKLSVFLAILITLGTILPLQVNRLEVQAAVAEKVKIGNAISVEKKGAVYTSSDETVAYVNADGKVIGKKKGTAVITVKKGKSTKKITVQVVANAKKPSIYICTDEIAVIDNEILFTKEIQPTEDAGNMADTDSEGGDSAEDTKREDSSDSEDAISADSEEATLPDSEEPTSSDPEEPTSPDSEEPNSPDSEEPTEVQEERYTYRFTYRIRNTSSKTASRVIITGTLGDEKITFTAKKLAPGGKIEFLHEGTAESDEVSFVPTKLQVYSNGMIHSYSYAKDKYSLQYAAADTKAPVIQGFIGKNSYNGNIPYQTIYSKDAKTYDYFKYVSAEDDRDTKVKLEVDTSKVDFSKSGSYQIKYIATDSAGNQATAKARIQVRVATSLDQMCDTVLKSIIKEDWSDTKKAQAIYKYVRGHIAYTGSSDKSSWEKEAANGIRYGRGDCFTYYAVARALLTRAGIVNIEVKRVQGYGHHWWNMVYVQGAFYHFDATPRRAGGNFCLVTDSQLKSYSSSHGNSHIWDYKNKPKSGTKIISSIN